MPQLLKWTELDLWSNEDAGDDPPWQIIQLQQKKSNSESKQKKKAKTKAKSNSGNLITAQKTTAFTVMSNDKKQAKKRKQSSAIPDELLKLAKKIKNTTAFT